MTKICVAEGKVVGEAPRKIPGPGTPRKGKRPSPVSVSFSLLQSIIQDQDESR